METQPGLTNLYFLDDFTKGDRNKMKRYVEMYLKSTPAVIDEFQSEFESQNFDGLKLKAHSIKPQAQYMGIISLKDVLIEIESIIKSGGNKNDLPALIEKAKSINLKVISELETFLKNN